MTNRQKTTELEPKMQTISQKCRASVKNAKLKPKTPNSIPKMQNLSHEYGKIKPNTLNLKCQVFCLMKIQVTCLRLLLKKIY